MKKKFSFKVWRLTGELIYEYKTNENQELWQVLWQPGCFPRGERPAVAGPDGSEAGKREKISSFDQKREEKCFLLSNSKSSSCLSTSTSSKYNSTSTEITRRWCENFR